jgi:hypothetical protein
MVGSGQRFMRKSSTRSVVGEKRSVGGAIGFRGPLGISGSLGSSFFGSSEMSFEKMDPLSLIISPIVCFDQFRSLW